MTHKTERTSQTEILVYSKGFGQYDSKGREIGLQIKTFETTYEDIKIDRQFGFDSRKAGVYFECCACNLRDDELFGRVHSARHFETNEERKSFLSKLLESSLKAAAK